MERNLDKRGAHRPFRQEVVRIAKPLGLIACDGILVLACAAIDRAITIGSSMIEYGNPFLIGVLHVSGDALVFVTIVRPLVIYLFQNIRDTWQSIKSPSEKEDSG